MKNYQTILFDLDGTLTDSGLGIANAAKYALEKMNVPVTDPQVFHQFVGPPLLESFEKYFGLTRLEAEHAIEIYREYYQVTGLFENTVYEGIRESLEKLKQAGKTLLVATSKPEETSKRILEYFDLAKYFTYIAGASLDASRNAKADVIAYAMTKTEAVEKEQVLMVGDREYDILGAKANGFDSMGVVYGYGSREELVSAGADLIAERPEEISRILLEE